MYGGLDRASYAILRTLAEGGPGAVRAIADRLGLDGSTVTRQTAALQALGLVTRTPDPADRRASIVELTPGGRARMTRVRRQRLELVRTLFDGWGEGELVELARTLTHLNATLAEWAAEERHRR